MIKTKRLLSIILVIALTVSALVGCKSGTSEGSDYEWVSVWEEDVSDSKDKSNQKNPNKDKNNKDNSGNKNSSSSSDKNGVNTTGFPIVKDTVTLRILCTKIPLHTNGFDKLAFTTDYEKKTNVKIKWELMETNQNEKIVAMMSSGNFPDVIISDKVLRSSQVEKYGTAGAFLELKTSEIKKYAPNVYKAISSNKNVKKAITCSNGKIYSIPAVDSDMGNQTYAHKMFINKAWLTKLGLSMPKTYSDFIKVMEAFVKQDPNGNGINDEIGIAVSGVNGMLAGAPQGIEWNGTYDSMYVDGKGKIHYFYASEAYRSSIKFLNKLYKINALDWSVFTNKKSVAEVVSTGKVGCFIALNGSTMLSESNCADYTIMPPLKATASSTPVVITTRGQEIRPYNMIITSSAKNGGKKEVALRWVDYFFTPEGYFYKEYGPNGGYYNSNGDGTYSKVTTVVNGKSVAKYTDADRYALFTPGYVLPGCPAGKTDFWKIDPNRTLTSLDKFYSDIDDKLSVSTYKNYQSKKYIPYGSIKFSEDEEYQLSQFNSTLHKYVKDCVNSFVSGQSDIDTNWSKYQTTMSSYGLEKLEKLYQSAYDRG